MGNSKCIKYDNTKICGIIAVVIAKNINNANIFLHTILF